MEVSSGHLYLNFLLCFQSRSLANVRITPCCQVPKPILAHLLLSFAYPAADVNLEEQ